MKISKRLQKIYEIIDPCDTVADIGADHGFLAQMIIEGGKAKKVIATDISAKSLEKTVNLINIFNLNSKIKTRVGDGLLVLSPREVDCAVIAGMGGHEIAKILGDEARVDKIQKFVLQPIQNPVNLRKWLVSHNYNIDYDECIMDCNKFYDIIVVHYCQKPEKLSFEQSFLGKTNLINMSDDFKKKLRYEQNRLECILESNAIIEEKEKDLKKSLKCVNKLLSKEF